MSGSMANENNNYHFADVFTTLGKLDEEFDSRLADPTAPAFLEKGKQFCNEVRFKDVLFTLFLIGMNSMFPMIFW